MNLKQNQKGFTIVELLIVIVVIAILAAISIVAFTGIQDRARTSSGQSLASQVEKKAQTYYTLESTYPMNQAAFGTGPAEANLEGSVGTFTAAATITEAQADSGKAIAYISCNNAVRPAATQAASTGAIISYWNFQTDANVSKIVGDCA